MPSTSQTPTIANMFSMILAAMSFESHAEKLLRKLRKAETWARKQPKFKVKPQPKNIVQTYEANNLLYIRYRATIIDKGEGKKKIGPGNRPKNFPAIVKQIKYNDTSGKYYSLLMGKEYQPNRFVLLIDIDNKEEKGTINGIEFMNLLNLDQYQAPKQSTPSGGFHFLFYFDEKQKQLIKSSGTTMQYEGKVYNVDFKFTNQLCNCAPSKIDNYGEYTWLNPEKLGDIPKLPEKLFALISNKPAPLKKILGNPLGSPNCTNPVIDAIPANTLSPEEPVDVKNVDQDDIRQLCECLSKARLNNRQDWINLGLCLKRIGPPAVFGIK